MLKKNIITLIVIFVLAVTAGSLFLKFAPDFGIRENAAEYNEIGRNLAQGNGYVKDNLTTGTRAPGYPYFLGIIYFILGHNPTAVKIIQFVLLAIIGVFVYMISKRLSMAYIFALLAAVLVVVWPYFILYSNLILAEILFALLLIISVYILLLFQKTPNYLKATIIGVMLGSATLVRPSAILLPIWITLGLVLIFHRFRQQKNFLKLLVLIAAFIITLTPWTVRNYLEFGKLMPVRPGLSATAENAFVDIDYLEPSQEGMSSNEGVTKIQNVYRFWNPGASGSQARELTDKYPNSKILILIYQIGFFLILASTFISLKFYQNKKIVMLWLIIFYFCIIHAVLYPYPRYTLPIIPIVMVLCFFTISVFYPKLLKRIKHSGQKSNSIPNPKQQR